MGIEIDTSTPAGVQAALAALAWQIDCGVTEFIGDDPVNAYDLPEKPPWSAKPAAPTAATTAPGTASAPRAAAPQRAPTADFTPQISAEQRQQLAADEGVATAEAAARAAPDLDALRAAIAGFEHCELKQGAKSLVFSDGQPGARVMVLGEAPDRDEDLQGKPFVGPAGDLLDKMFAAIGLSRANDDLQSALYIASPIPWRTLANRFPTPQEEAMMRPFLERHIELAKPNVIVLMGNVPCSMLLGAKAVTRLRGTWTTALGTPVMPMLHPQTLIERPAAKREAWADLLAIKARLSS
jgi:uracil-DNA glycosylase